MIDLKMIIQTLEALDRRKITQEDILGVYVDLYEAVRLSGVQIWELPVDDRARLAQYLNVCGTNFLRTAKYNGELLSEEDPDGHLARQSEKIGQRMSELQENLNRIEKERNELETKQSELENEESKVKEKAEELKREHADLKKTETRYEQLRKSSDALEDEIRRLRRLDVSAAESKEKELVDLQKSILVTIDELKEHCTGLTAGIEELETQKASLLQEKKDKQDKADGLKKENELYSSEIERIEEDTREKERENSRLFNDLRSVQKENESLKDALKDLDGAKENVDLLKKENDRLSDEFKDGKRKLDEQWAEQRKRRNELEAGQQELKQNETDLQKEKSSLDKEYETLSEKNKSLRKIEDECEQLRKKIVRLKEIDLQEAEKIYSDLSDKQIGYEEQIHKQRAEYKQKLEDLKRKFESEKEKFDREEIPEFNKRIKRITNKLNLISELKKSLGSELENGVVAGGSESVQVLEELDGEIAKCERSAKAIARKYEQITKILDE